MTVPPRPPLDHYQDAPPWPDFHVHRDGEWAWASTNAGRPGSPIFTMVLKGAAIEAMTDDEVRVAAEERLWAAYNHAHPNGCPGTH